MKNILLFSGFGSTSNLGIILVIYNEVSKATAFPRNLAPAKAPIWCGDKLKGDRFRGRCLQRGACTRVHSLNNDPNLCAHNMHVHICI